MKLTPRTRIQLVVFGVITVFSLAYALWSYGGVQRSTGIGTYEVRAQFTDAGNLYPKALVTYRGTDIGVVQEISVRDGGVTVTMQLESARKVPDRVHASILSVSAIGEQYVDLVPDVDSGPYLSSGEVIPVSDTTSPTSVGALLTNADDLIRSVPTDKLQTLVDETHKALENTGPALSTLIRSSQRFIELAQGSLPQTLSLIDQGEPVLDAVNETGDDVRSYVTDLASFTTQLTLNDTQIREVLATGPRFANTLAATFDENAITLPTLLGDLQAVGQTLKVYVPALRQILVVYPAIASAVNSATQGYQLDNDLFKAQAGLDVKVGNTLVPPPCTNGYQGTVRRDPSDVSDARAKYGAYCDVRKNDSRLVRGARNLPCLNDIDVRTAFVQDCPGGPPSTWPSTQSTIAPPRSAVGASAPATAAAPVVSPTGRVPTAQVVPYDPASGRVTLADGRQVVIPQLAQGAKAPGSLEDLLLGGENT